MGDLLRRLSSLRSLSTASSSASSPSPSIDDDSPPLNISSPISVVHFASPSAYAARPTIEIPSPPQSQSQSQPQSQSQSQHEQEQSQQQSQSEPQSHPHSQSESDAGSSSSSSLSPSPSPFPATTASAASTATTATASYLQDSTHVNQQNADVRADERAPLQATRIPIVDGLRASNMQQAENTVAATVATNVAANPTTEQTIDPDEESMNMYIQQIRRMAMEAVISNRHQTLQDFFNAGVFNIDEMFGGRVQRTLLHCAASFGSKECVDIILRNGANINTQDSSGNTALLLSAQNGYKECLKILLDRGADTQIRNKDGFTALHWLATNGHSDLLKIVIEKSGCNVDPLDHQNRTPLHMACQNGHKDSVLYLTKHGADIRKKDKLNRSTLYYACKFGQYECIKILLDLNLPLENQQGLEGPLELCLKAGSYKSCHLLLSKFPSMLSRLIQLTSQLDMEEQKVSELLDYLCSDQWRHDSHGSGLPRFSFQSFSALGSLTGSDSKNFKIPVIHGLEDVTAITGHQLLSLSSDAATIGDVFIRQMTFLAKLIPKDWGSRIAKEPPRRTSFRNPSSLLFSGISSSSSSPTNDESFLSRATTSSLSPGTMDSPGRGAKNSSNDSSEASGSNSSSVYRSPLEDLWATMEEWLLLLSSMSSSIVEKPLPPPEPSFFQRKSLSISDRKLQQAFAKFGLQDKLAENNGEGSQQISSETQSPGQEAQDLFVATSPQNLQAGTPTSPSDASKQAPLGDNDVQSRPDIIASAQNTEETPGAGEPVTKENSSFDELLPRYFNRIAAIVHGFYLYCTSLEAGRKGELYDGPSSSTSRPIPKNRTMQKTLSPRFRKFVDDHLNILRLLVRHDPKVLFEHFHFLLDHHSIMNQFMDLVRSHPFELRKEWFYGNLDQLVREKTGNVQTDDFNEPDPFVVTRHNPFETSCGVLAKALSNEQEITVLSNFAIRFDGEAGLGAGVRREWFNVMSKEIVNPDYGLFIPSSDGSTVQPNTNSAINPDHLSYFRFAGWVVGLAILHRELLDVYFTRSFYKHILGSPISLNDLNSIDPEYYQSLKWLLENNIDDCGLELTFSVEFDSFGEAQLVELKPNGSTLQVTEENKHEYVQLAAEFKMTSAIGLQICSFLEGFERFVPHSLICMFDEYELELMVSGTPSIDLVDWRQNTEYSGMEGTDQYAEWFWEIVNDLNNNERVLLLQFVTGSSRVPLGGFGALMGSAGPTKFTLSLMAGEQDRLPTASTCFNLLKIPAYRSCQEFRDRLLIALRCGSKGFEFA